MWRGPSARVVTDAGPAPQAPPSGDRTYGKNWSAALLATTRPLSSVVAGTLAAAAAITGQGRLTLRGVAAGLGMTALAMFGFAVNDILDYHKDRAAGVQRPIAAGTLSRRSAAWLATALLLPVGLFSAVAGSSGMVVALTGAALLLYSPVAQRYPLTKDAFVAGLCCLPLYYGAQVGYRHFQWSSYAVLACFVLGREVLMDADELQGDAKSGIRTVAAILGGRGAARIGATLMLVSAAVLVALVHGRTAVLAAVATLVSLACLFAWPGLNAGRRIQLSRIPMLLGSVALACGGA
jgi:geranylgeranylglycerol-phosphate geranylgeranyltransferase